MENANLSPMSRQALYANKKEWNQFLSIFLLAAGVGFAVAGIIFFFAYNWNELPKYAKLGIVEILVVVTALLSIFTKWSTLVKQVLLTGATFLIGTLFAVYGQIYQTGADAYNLFLGWTLFTTLWAVASRFAALWLTFIGLLCTTIWLYVIQIIPDYLLGVTLLTNAVTWICASATIIAERLSTKGRMNKRNRWFIDVLSLATILHASFIMILAILEKTDFMYIPLISTVLLFCFGLWFGWKQRNLFYLATIPFAILIILLSLFIRHCNMKGIFPLLLSAIIVITGTTLIIYSILHLKKQWYDTAE